MLFGILIMVSLARALDALTLGEDTASTLGVSLRSVRLRIVFGVTMAVGAATAVTGTIGFVGLIVSHILRPFVGNQPSLLSVVSGQIEFNGASIASMRHEELAKCVAYLEQSSSSYWPLTVENIVMLGRLPHLGQWRNPSERDWIFVRDAMRACEVLSFPAVQ